MIGVKRILLLLCGLCAACTSTGEVRLAGQFTPEVPPPAEIRVMLDPNYEGEGSAQEAGAFISVFPDSSGYFDTGPIEVAYTKRQWHALPEPTFFVSFVNEQDVVYAAGQRHGVFQYRTYAAATKDESPREESCWRVMRGTFEGEALEQRKLMLFIGPNYDSPKHCLPEGNFTPGGFAPYKPLDR